MFAWRVVLATAVIALFAGTVPAQTGPSAGQTGASDRASENEIVVSAFPSNDIVVNGRAIRCRPATGDPLDRVSIPGWPDYMMIVPDDRGGFAAKHVTEQITGPEFWQRVGVGMDEQTGKRVPGSDWSFIQRQRGMFSYTGLMKDQVLCLRKEYAIGRLVGPQIQALGHFPGV